MKKRSTEEDRSLWWCRIKVADPLGAKSKEKEED